MKNKAILNFVYSRPYESALHKLAGETLSQEQISLGKEKAQSLQKIWNRYEKVTVSLFREIFRTEIKEKHIEVYVSQLLPNSFSHPMTISIKHHADFDKDEKQKRILIYVIIHELAHYFAYTRTDGFFDELHEKVKRIDLLEERGANLHYLIQAVEFGIGGELFGKESATLRRNWLIENCGSDEYGKSAKLLKEHNAPLDKTCLEYINTEILKNA